MLVNSYSKIYVNGKIVYNEILSWKEKFHSPDERVNLPAKTNPCLKQDFLSGV